MPEYFINKSIKFGRLKITFQWRNKDNLFGRFGGGWNWELGFQLGMNTLIINLLVCCIRFDIKKK